MSKQRTNKMSFREHKKIIYIAAVVVMAVGSIFGYHVWTAPVIRDTLDASYYACRDREIGRRHETEDGYVPVFSSAWAGCHQIYDAWQLREAKTHHDNPPPEPDIVREGVSAAARWKKENGW
jgi:hypothetical protein